MKKNLFLYLFILISISVFSQVRFFNLYPGWVIFSYSQQETEYTFCGLDTLNLGYENTPIVLTTELNGTLTESVRNVIDTIEGFSFYSKQNYSYYTDGILASGVIKETLKSYLLIPVICYFNKYSYYIDSIRNFKSEFAGKSSRIMLHLDNEDKILLLGEVQYSMDANIRTFFGIYDPVADTFSYKDYERPNYCKMTPYQILPTSDGGYLLATEQDMTYMDEKVYACILKIDQDGNEMWRYVIQGQTNIPPWGLQAATFRPRIFNSPDGDYFVVWTDPFFNEYINQPNSESTIRIAKLKDYGTYGELTEEKDLRSELDNFERAPYIINDAFQDEDGTMYILMQSDGGYQSALAKIHPNGVGAWMRVYICYPDDDASISSTKLYGISKTDDGGFMLTGAFNSTFSTLFPSGMIASCVFKTDSCGCFDAEGCNSHCADSYAEYFVTMPEASIYPNPARDKITVGFDYEGGDTEFEYRIYSLDGKLLSNGTTRQESRGKDSITTGIVGGIESPAQGNCNLKIDICDLPSGYYMIQFWGGGKIFTGKFVKE